MGQFRFYEEGVVEERNNKETSLKDSINLALRDRSVTAHFQEIRDNRNPDNPEKHYESLMRIPGLSP